MGNSDRLRSALAAAVAFSLLVPPTSIAAQSDAPAKPSRKAYQAGELHGDDRILHALNRFTFGPRPGDLEAVRSEGLEKWFAEQLHPDTINNFALEVRLSDFPAMQLSPQDLLYRLPSNAIIRQTMDGKLAVPGNGALHVIYENEIARYEARQQEKELAKRQQASLSASAMTPPIGIHSPSGNGRTMIAGSVKTGAESLRSSAAQTEPNHEPGQMNMSSATVSKLESPAPSEAQIAAILAMPPAQRVARIAAMPQPEFDSFRKALKGAQRVSLNAGLTAVQKEFVAALENPQHVVVDEISEQRLVRDIYSNAQLQEVMTDFWLNHFNVFLHKNDETPYYLVSYERDVIRPRALGKFEDLLEATAHSPAMLLYLDNSSSMGPDSPAAEKAKIAAARKPTAKKQAPEGLNENYARELMELHTLGVNGGYTQADVTQVARVLTGWTVDKPQRGGGFKFDENRHEPGTKKVLGKKIKEHGEQEGRELLHLLATRPATAKFISRKLAIRFVGDDPPQSLIDHMAKSYLSSGGDISAVLNTLFHSYEFWSPDAYRAKIKTPIEFVASAARASDASVDSAQQLVYALRDMGMPLYGAVPPTGYKWDASDWVSTGALVNRMNFALTMAANKLTGVSVNWSEAARLGQAESMAIKVNNGVQTQTFMPSAGQTPSAPHTPTPAPAAGSTPSDEEQRLESSLIAGGVSASTRAAVLNQFNAQTQAPASQTQNYARPTPIAAKPLNPIQAANALEKQDQVLAGLLLGSPEFQRR